MTLWPASTNLRGLYFSILTKSKIGPPRPRVPGHVKSAGSNGMESNGAGSNDVGSNKVRTNDAGSNRTSSPDVFPVEETKDATSIIPATWTWQANFHPALSSPFFFRLNPPSPGVSAYHPVPLKLIKSSHFFTTCPLPYRSLALKYVPTYLPYLPYSAPV